MVRDLDLRSPNRSQFIQEAVRHELLRRRREELSMSLRAPHPESMELADQGLADWAHQVPEDQVSDLLDPNMGRDVRWDPDVGWREVDE